jgi:hypothetical protein
VFLLFFCHSGKSANIVCHVCLAAHRDDSASHQTTAEGHRYKNDQRQASATGQGEKGPNDETWFRRAQVSFFMLLFCLLTIIWQNMYVREATERVGKGLGARDASRAQVCFIIIIFSVY